MADVLQTLDEADYDILPSNGDLVAAEVQLMNVENREMKLRSIINSVRDNYDFIVIDCPPSLNMLTINALVAAERRGYPNAM